MMAVAVCSVILSMPVRDYHHSMATCLHVASYAQTHEQPIHLMVSLSYMESRLTWDAFSPKGALGPMQVMPYWVVKNRDKALAGIYAWKYWRRRSITDRVAVAKYNAGYKPGRKSFDFANKVMKLSNRIHDFVGGVVNAD